MIVLSLLFTVLVCFGVPLGGMLLARKRFQGRWGLFLAGALTFFISQICLRLPLIQFVLPNFEWYLVLPFHLWHLGFFLGATAALFEEVARWLAMRVLKRRGRLEPGLGNGFAFGLGHGGIEAVFLVGINALVMLVMTVLSPGASPVGMFPLEAGKMLASGVERLSTLAFHVGASLIVMYGIAARKEARYLLLAFVLHTVTDAAVIILPTRFGVGIMAMEICIAVFGGATLAIGIILFTKKRKDGDVQKQRRNEG